MNNIKELALVINELSNKIDNGKHTGNDVIKLKELVTEYIKLELEDNNKYVPLHHLSYSDIKLIIQAISDNIRNKSKYGDEQTIKDINQLHTIKNYLKYKIE
jgi:hypothetical protein